MLDSLIALFLRNPFGWVLFLVFYSVIAFFLYKNRRKIQRQSILFLYRTKKGIAIIEKFARFKRFWKYWGYTGIFFGFLGMGFIVYYLIRLFIRFLVSPGTAETAVKLVLPGPFAADTSLFMLIPVEYFIPVLLIVIIVHEGCHGILSRVHQMKILSTGLGMFLFLPLAFVEPDEKSLGKKPLKDQLSVFAAGPFANLCSAFLIFILAILLFNPAIFGSSAFFEKTENPVVFSLVEDGPFEQAGIPVRDEILTLNGIEINNVVEFSEFMSGLSPGDILTVETSSGIFSVETVEHPNDPEIGYAGVFLAQFELRQIFQQGLIGKIMNPFLIYLSTLLEWLILLNIGIGLFNLLPLGPVDGGRMVKAVIDRFVSNKKTATTLFKFISLSTLGLLLVAIFGPLLFSIVGRLAV